MTENEAWEELERKQNKQLQKFTENMALQIAYNALSAINKKTPSQTAEYALMVVGKVLNKEQT
jgi:hypothetical protein